LYTTEATFVHIDAWECAATVAMVGKVLEWSVLSSAERLVVHEKPHVKQIERIVTTVR